jgi:osmotically-inducible protein OsmY
MLAVAFSLGTTSYLHAAAVAADAAADTAISQEIKTKIDAEPAHKDNNITVTAKDGVVTLAGSLASPVTRLKAVEIAQSAQGVTKVVNKIKISKGK